MMEKEKEGSKFVLNELEKAVIGFEDGTQRHDDITAVAVRIRDY